MSEYIVSFYGTDTYEISHGNLRLSADQLVEILTKQKAELAALRKVAVTALNLKNDIEAECYEISITGYELLDELEGQLNLAITAGYLEER